MLIGEDFNAIVNENYSNSLLETLPSFNSFDPLSPGESTMRLHLVSEKHSSNGCIVLA